jgi:predicted transcriptional regulator
MSRLSLSTIYKLLKELLVANWIQEYQLKGNNKDEKGQVYIKYVSDTKILTNTYNIKSKPLYVVAPYKLLHNKAAIKGRCYLGQMNFNQAVIESKLDYSIGKRKIKGELLPLSTVKAENKRLRYPTNKAKVGPLDSSINDLKSAITGKCYDSNTSNYGSVQAHISFSIKGQRGVRVLNKSSYKVAAITSQTLANKLNVNRRTVDKYLRQYSKDRV